MADDPNNKKNIDDSKQSLNDFNAALKESIDLSKQLAKAVSSLSPSLGLSESMNKKLVKGVNEYKDALSDTLKLSNKVAAGRAKTKEIEDKIAILNKKHKTFADENEKSFGRRGRFILKQKDLQKEILALEEKELKRRDDIAAADGRIDEINQKIARQREIADSVISTTGKKAALDKIKLLKEQLKEEQETITVSETLSKNADKIIAQKQKEKDKVDQTIEAYKAIEKSYEDQIKNAEILLEKQKEQSIISKLTSGDINKFSQGIKEATALLSPLVAAFNAIKKFAFGISDQVTKLQKGLVLSRDEAYGVRKEFNNIAIASGDIAINTNRLIEANAALGKQLGFNSKFTLT